MSRQSLCSFPLSIIFLAYIVLSVLIAGGGLSSNSSGKGKTQQTATAPCWRTQMRPWGTGPYHECKTSRRRAERMTHTHRNGKAWKKGARSALAMERERERHLLAKDVADLDGRTPLSLAEKGLLNHLNGCGMQPCARFLAEFSDFFNGRERT